MSEPLQTSDPWEGGDYELYIEIVPTSGEGLVRALETIWSTPGMQPSDSGQAFSAESWIRGLVTLPDGVRVVCETFAQHLESGVDFLSLAIPMGALGSAYPRVGGFPFGSEDSRSWREPLDLWFAEVARKVFSRVPFQLGLIGFDVSSEDLTRDVGHRGIPTDRWDAYLWCIDGSLRFFPATIWDPPISF